MRIFLFVIMIFFMPSVYSQDNNCHPTIKIEAMVFPNKFDSSFSCPVGACCYKQIKSKDARLEVISFRMYAYKICNQEDDVYEIDNIGNTFSPVSRMILNKVCSGTELMFTCIKAKNKEGKVFILQPFNVILE